MVATALGIVRFVQLIPQYADEWPQALAGLQSWLAGLGLTITDIQSVLSDIDPGTIASLAESLLSGLSSVLSATLFSVVLLIFLAVDGGGIPAADVPGPARPRGRASTGCAAFASGTRRYFGVATIFGGIVAVLDTAALSSWASRPRSCGACWRSSPTTSPTSASSSG